MNPKIKDFLEDNPDMTLLGLSWALFWRLWVVMYGVIIGVSVLVGFVGSL